MSDNLLECFGKFPKLAAHLHLPIQSGSDRILSAMKRNYTALEYKNIIRKLKKNCPQISISSDFIVGFPNETDADFELTKKLKIHAGVRYSYFMQIGPFDRYLKDPVNGQTSQIVHYRSNE
ncbi:MAG: isopentenyl-adenosine tRNA methylthiolase, partial [Pseudomonadota bacterium]